MPGSFANFVIWVWTTQAQSTGIAVDTSVLNGANIGTPAFLICPASSGTKCTVGTLLVGQAEELEAKVAVSAQATVGEQWQLEATASGTGAIGYSATATDVVTATAPTPSPTPITTPTTPSPTLPVNGSLPPVAGTGVSPTNPSSLFPTVGTSTGTGSLNLPPAKSRSALRAADTAASVPLDARLLGGQIAGLVVLAAAIAIAITRLSLRRQKAGETGATKPPEQ